MKRNNKWRRRIIRVLEKLLEDLQSRPPGPTQSEAINESADLCNQASSVADGRPEVEVAESLYYFKKIPIPKTNYNTIHRLADCLEDAAFGVYCSMQDATYFRLFSARAWRDFALGSIGVQTASFATNCAIAQLRGMEAQLRGLFDHLEDDAWSRRMHMEIDLFIRGYIADDMECENTRPGTVDLSFDHVSLARHAARKLGFYASTLQCSQLSTLLSGAFLEPEDLRAAARFLEKPEALLEQYKDLQTALSLEGRSLLKSLAQLRCLEWSNDRIAGIFRDDYMHVAAKTLVLGHMDSRAVFAAQMLYDIQQETDPQNVSSEDILEAVSDHYLQLYNNYGAEWKNGSHGDNRFTRVEQMHVQYDFLCRMVQSENDLQARLERWEVATPKQHTIPQFNIVRHVPLLLGTVIFQYHDHYERAFLEIANDRGHILTAIHLYNAAKKSGSLPPRTRWDDLEWVIDNQVEGFLFGGKPPERGHQYVKSFCDAYGLNSSKFTTGHRLVNPEQVKTDIHRGVSRRLESASKFVRACAEIRALPESSRPDFRFRMAQAFADYQLYASSVHGSPHNIGVLIAAKETGEDDEEAHSFDIFALHMTCERLLSSIRRTCFEYAPDDYPGTRYDGTEGLNTTIAELLRDLLDCPRHHSRMWPKAMEVLADVIRREGSACGDMAAERMSMMTTSSISLDSEGSESATTSAGNETPSSEQMEVDEHRALKAFRVDDGEEPHRPSKRPKLSFSGLSARVTTQRSEEWHRVQQEVIREFSNLRVEYGDPRIHHLLTPTNKVLTSWAPEESQQMIELVSVRYLCSHADSL